MTYDDDKDAQTESWMLVWSDLMHLNTICKMSKYWEHTHAFSSGKHVKVVLKMNINFRQKAIYKAIYTSIYKACKSMHTGNVTHKYTIYKYIQYIQYIQLPAQGPDSYYFILLLSVLPTTHQVICHLRQVSRRWHCHNDYAQSPLFWLPTLATGIVSDPSYIFPFLHSTLLKGPTLPVPLCEPGHRSSWSRNKWSWACTGCWGTRSCRQHPSCGHGLCKVWCSGGRCDGALPGGSSRRRPGPQIRSLPLPDLEGGQFMRWAWCRRKELQFFLRWWKLVSATGMGLFGAIPWERTLISCFYDAVETWEKIICVRYVLIRELFSHLAVNNLFNSILLNCVCVCACMCPCVVVWVYITMYTYCEAHWVCLVHVLYK